MIAMRSVAPGLDDLDGQQAGIGVHCLMIPRHRNETEAVEPVGKPRML
jgi:hypothetical protein